MIRSVWRKSSHSGTEQGACVELTDLCMVVGVRDSKAPELGHLSVSRTELRQLVDRVKRGELDLA